MQLYLLKHGDAAGPYEEPELREMLAAREATPDTPARRADEEAWSTLAACLGIKGPPKLGGSEPTAPPSPETSDDSLSAYKSRHETVPKPKIHEKFRGIERGLYITIYVAGVILYFTTDPERSAIEGYAFLAYAVLYIWASIQRMRNVGENLLWLLLNFVPFANLYVGYLCIVAPPNYAKTKQLDSLGERLRPFYYILCLPTLLLAALVILFVLFTLFVRFVLGVAV